jgi:hypothetical protein
MAGIARLYMYRITYQFSYEKATLSSSYILEDIFGHSRKFVAEGKSELSLMGHK